MTKEGKGPTLCMRDDCARVQVHVPSLVWLCGVRRTRVENLLFVGSGRTCARLVVSSALPCCIRQCLYIVCVCLQAVAPGLPMWSAPAAYAVLAARLGPYLTEASMSLKLLTNHVTRWQVRGREGGCMGGHARQQGRTAACGGGRQLA